MDTPLIDLKVLNETEYLREITRKISAAKKDTRIVLMTMKFDPEEGPIRKLLQAAIKACKRGANVTFVTDAHAFMVNYHTDLPTGPMFRHRSIHSAKTGYFGGKLQILNELEDAGGQYHVINVPKTRLINPVGGRSHIKATIMGDELYIGGRNLSESHRIDLMVRTKDKTAVSYMSDLIDKIVETGDARTAMQDRDFKLALDGYTSLLVDSGVPKQSLIYEQALELIDEADEWIVMTCQYFPNSTTARHLNAARKRGVKVQLFYDHPTRYRKHVEKFAHRLVNLQERARHHKDLFALQRSRRQRSIHAKLIATEKGAIIGSHNYVTAGVILGTAETAMLRRDPAFAQKAAEVIEKSLSAE